MIDSKTQGHGTTRAHSIRAWILDFVHEETLSFHSYGYTRKTVLENKDVLKAIQDTLSERERARF